MLLHAVVRFSASGNYRGLGASQTLNPNPDRVCRKNQEGDVACEGFSWSTSARRDHKDQFQQRPDCGCGIYIQGCMRPIGARGSQVAFSGGS